MMKTARVAEQRHSLLPDSVVAWRINRLRDGGFDAELADALARNRGYDLHAVLDLTERGCPPRLAARILAPADTDSAPC